MNLISALVPISIGQAVQNLTPGQRVLEVMPIEHVPGVDGDDITSGIERAELNGVDPDGNAYSVSVDSSTGIPCTWLPFGSNRLTPPDIRRKERVVIYRFADEDKYYWKELGLDDAMRRLETVIYFWNANPNINSKDEIDINNCYYFEVSPRTGAVTFQTSKANGEPYRYTFQIDAAEGRWTSTDDVDNFVEVDSKETLIRLHNAMGTYVELLKKNFTLFAPDSATLVGVNTFKIQTKVFRLAASQSVTVDSPISTFTGDVKIDKNLTVSGKLAAGSVESASVKAGTMYATTYQNLPPR